MTTSKKRSSVTVSKTSIDQATQTLQSLPEKPKQGWSLREAIDQMNDVISAAISKGYSYEELVELLRGQGIEISVSSLKNYLTRSKRESSAAAPAKATRKPRGRKPKSDQADAQSNTANGATPEAEDKGSADESAAADAPTAPTSTEPEAPAKRGRRPRSSSRTQAAAKNQSENQVKVSPSNGRKTRRKKDTSLAS
ncbi:hypothetical protein H6G89_09675 [Oscillatoria sp. FACHB-1407]|uniref:hypothetical protein n=1 Tax=Oscillatoria sp. FACHB-1407 TaxID=2692847 RepID=UPI001688C06A|nr:hypothetical protein [Oscillatoria sp. FACHB-1407]MBD2461315.1 hypothetical protein [Oscillatoria sp. FACHB-1407]